MMQLLKIDIVVTFNCVLSRDDRMTVLVLVLIIGLLLNSALRMPKSRQAHHTIIIQTIGTRTNKVLRAKRGCAAKLVIMLVVVRSNLRPLVCEVSVSRIVKAVLCNVSVFRPFVPSVPHRIILHHLRIGKVLLQASHVFALAKVVALVSSCSCLVHGMTGIAQFRACRIELARLVCEVGLRAEVSLIVVVLLCKQVGLHMLITTFLACISLATMS
jgi:hypothetical protein